jgi:uncharacterized membrane protein YhaH (DUF805 family)
MDPNAVIEIFRKTVTEHYVDFQGRCARRDFWYFVVGYFVLYVGVAIIQSVILNSHLLTGLLSLALLLPGLGIAVRRLHDIDRSGWWILIGVVPGFLAALSSMLALITGSIGLGFGLLGLVGLVGLAAAVLLIYWYAQPGTAGDNQFGPPPPLMTTGTTVNA